jgi:hypothetical protein
MLRILYLVHVQQMRYLESLPEIINYAALSITSVDFVEPPSS